MGLLFNFVFIDLAFVSIATQIVASLVKTFKKIKNVSTANITKRILRDRKLCIQWSSKTHVKNTRRFL